MAALGTRALVMRMGSTPTDMTSAVADVRIKAAESDSDFVSFADAAAGGARKYTLAVKAVQDTATGSLWDQVWSHAGEEIAVEVWPNGRPVSGTPTTTQPKFSGTVVVLEPDGDLLGGEANKSATQRFIIEVEWEFTAKPTRTTA